MEAAVERLPARRLLIMARRPWAVGYGSSYVEGRRTRACAKLALLAVPARWDLVDALRKVVDHSERSLPQEVRSWLKGASMGRVAWPLRETARMAAAAEQGGTGSVRVMGGLAERLWGQRDAHAAASEGPPQRLQRPCGRTWEGAQHVASQVWLMANPRSLQPQSFFGGIGCALGV